MHNGKKQEAESDGRWPAVNEGRTTPKALARSDTVRQVVIRQDAKH